MLLYLAVIDLYIIYINKKGLILYNNSKNIFLLILNKEPGKKNKKSNIFNGKLFLLNLKLGTVFIIETLNFSLDKDSNQLFKALPPEPPNAVLTPLINNIFTLFPYYTRPAGF